MRVEPVWGRALDIPRGIVDPDDDPASA
jgi:hypothetical protein